jgi:hypothetical protein
MKTKSLLGFAGISLFTILFMNTPSLADLSNLDPVIAILKDDMPRLSKFQADMISDELTKSGLKAKFITMEEAADSEKFNADRYDCLVLINGALNPIAMKRNLWDYLRYGGKLVVLGGPPFSDLTWKDNGKWVNMESFLEQLTNREDKKPIYTFDEGNVSPSAWKRETNNVNSLSEVKQVSPGAAGTKNALQIEVADLTGWDQFLTNIKPEAFPDEESALCFMAKGDKNTGFLAVEVREDDASRWISMIKLSTDWQYYVLSSNDFMYWADSKVKGRGFRGDRFNPVRASVMSFGLANDITPVGTGRHMFWVDEISALSVGEYTNVAKEAVKPVIYETMSPKYKLYEVSGIATLKPSARQDIFTAERWALQNPLKGFLPIARMTGEGYSKTKRSRWIPLYDGYDSDGYKKGTPVSIMLDWKRYKGAKWAYLGVTDRDFYKMPETLSFVKDVIINMVSSPSLLCGGSDKYTYFTNEPVLLGGKIVNPVKKNVSVTLRITAKKGNAPVYSVERSTTLAPMEEFSFDEPWKPESKDAEYTVRTELLEDNKVIDAVEHQIFVLENYPDMKPEDRITVKDGKFMMGGNVWKPVGLNYWPSYVAGLEPYDYYQHWLLPKYYDPVEVEKDIYIMEKMGMNVVSIQYTAKEHAPALIDFLRRLNNHKIKANIFLGYSDPLAGNYSKKTMWELINSARLVNNPAVFAYDIAWEPNLRMVEIRQEFDTEWNAWVDEQYGSKKNAVKEWKYSPQTVGSRKLFTAPTNDMLAKDGEWRYMVIAYRRFIDDLASRRYNAGCAALREIDPNHLLGARSGYGGNGMTQPENMAFDLFCSAKHLDFISPEWYSLTRPEETMKGGFNVIYAKFVSNNKPVFWAEFGVSVWDPIHNGASEDILSKQSKYYNNFISMAWKAGSQGLAAWWFPGGFRADEKSDFGLFNPDRTARPAVESMMKAVALFQTEPGDTTPQHFIKIDRYGSMFGYNDVYNKGKDEYFEAINSGKFPGIQTEATGLNSASVPLATLSNTVFTGAAPLKYLNAEFNSVMYSKDGINWTSLKSGDEVQIAKNSPLFLKCSVGNTSDAEWLNPVGALETSGKVFVTSTDISDIIIEQPITQNTKYFDNAEVASFSLTGGIEGKPRLVELRMTAKDRAQFGEKFRFTLVPRD